MAITRITGQHQKNPTIVCATMAGTSLRGRPAYQNARQGHLKVTK